MKAISDRVKARQGCNRPANRTVAHATGTNRAIVPTEGMAFKFEGGNQPAIVAKVRLASRQDIRDFLFFVRKGGLMVQLLQVHGGDVKVWCETSDTAHVYGSGTLSLLIWGTTEAVLHFTRQVICLEWCQPTTTRVSWQGQGSAPAEFVKPRRVSDSHAAALKVEDHRAKEACKAKAAHVTSDYRLAALGICK